MATAAPARDGRKMLNWTPPRPSRKAVLTLCGLLLALGSWAAQTYLTVLWTNAAQERERLRQSLALARLQREMWMIEYNASQLRFPRNGRVTGRAAFHVFENTRDLLAMNEAAAEADADRLAEIWRQRDRDVAQARELLDQGAYSTLVSGLNRANEQFETEAALLSLRQAAEPAGIPIWQHILPWTLLTGVLLCAAGALARGAPGKPGG